MQPVSASGLGATNRWGDREQREDGDGNASAWCENKQEVGEPQRPVGPPDLRCGCVPETDCGLRDDGRLALNGHVPSESATDHPWRVARSITRAAPDRTAKGNKKPSRSDSGLQVRFFALVPVEPTPSIGSSNFAIVCWRTAVAAGTTDSSDKLDRAVRAAMAYGVAAASVSRNRSMRPAKRAPRGRISKRRVV